MGKCKDCGAELGGSASTKDYREHYKVCPTRKIECKKCDFELTGISEDGQYYQYQCRICGKSHQTKGGR
jgi:DNA-directed RNA polymerase subunit RPC12/RpoP